MLLFPACHQTGKTSMPVLSEKRDGEMVARRKGTWSGRYCGIPHRAARSLKEALYIGTEQRPMKRLTSTGKRPHSIHRK